MNCKTIQEYIVTDYIDRQMNDKRKAYIDQHLSSCPMCLEYLNKMNREVIAPFVNAPKEVPDQLLWSRIKAGIQEEEQMRLEESLKPGFWENFKSALHIPRPAFALATFVTMIFMVGLSGQLFFSAPVVKVNGAEQVEYLSSLIDEPVDADANNGNDSKTPIEQYFL